MPVDSDEGETPPPASTREGCVVDVERLGVATLQNPRPFGTGEIKPPSQRDFCPRHKSDIGESFWYGCRSRR